MASDIRTLSTTALLLDGQIAALIVDRLYQPSSVPKEPEFPYAVIKLGNEIPLPRWSQGPTRILMELWVFDRPGDYGNIDAVFARAKAVLPLLGNAGGVVEVRFTRTSPDIEEKKLGAITKYIGFTWTLAA